VVCDEGADAAAREAHVTKRGKRAPTRSGYHGVYLHDDGVHWDAVLSLGQYDRLFIARFEDPETAAVAYDRVARGVLGAKARLNFPERSLRRATVATIRREIRRTRKSKTTSRYLGVSWKADSSRWYAQISDATRRPRPIGTYERETDAAVARDRAALYMYGRHARLNFPNARLTPASPEVLRAENQKRRKARQASRFRGVYYDGDDGAKGRPWNAKIRQFVELGNWPTEEAAALAYDRAALYYWGDRALLNRPRAAKVAGPASPNQIAAQARQTFKRHATSRYLGVIWHKPRKKWCARIRHNYVLNGLGYYDDEEEAARAYDAAALRIRGERARLNFHPTTDEPLLGQRIVEPTRRGRAPAVLGPAAPRRRRDER
jgi:hypothetical protein